MLTDEERGRGWRDMETAPRDGTRFTVLVSKAGAVEVTAANLFFGEPIMGAREKRVLRGEHNHLSRHCTPRGWKAA